MTATTGVEYFSLADAGGFEEEIIENYRGDLDANASLPPLPHDVYVTRVSYCEHWPAKDGQEPEILAADPARRWRKQLAKDNKLMYLTWIHVVTENCANPEHDKRERDEVLTTYPNQRGITGAQALLQGFEVDTVMLNSHQQQMQALDQKLAGEGSLTGAEFDWEATVFDKNAVQRDKSGNPVIDQATGNQKTGVELWKLRGMRNFPAVLDGEGKPTGEYRPEIGAADGFLMKGPNNDMIPVQEARARLFIRRWVPIGKVNKLEKQLQQSVENVQAGLPANTPVQAQQPVQQRQAAPAPPAAPAARPTAPNRAPVRRVAG